MIKRPKYSLGLYFRSELYYKFLIKLMNQIQKYLLPNMISKPRVKNNHIHFFSKGQKKVIKQNIMYIYKIFPVSGISWD